MPGISKKRPVAESLLQRIRAAFPAVRWQSYAHNTEGWDHDVLILDDALVFRFPNDPEYATLLEREVAILRRLQPLVPAIVRIPAYSHVAADGSFAGYPLITGRQLTQSYFASLAPAGQQELARQLAAFLTAMHTATARGYDFHDVPPAYMADDQADVKRLAAAHLPSVLRADELRDVRRILRDADRVIASGHPQVFIHGDVYSSHLLWDDNARRLGVIDFSDMNRGDPAIDFADLYEYGPAFVREVYRQYGGLKDRTFLRRAWVYQQWIGVYMMTDHFVYRRNTFTEAREIFDWVRLPGADRYPRGGSPHER